MTRSKTKTSLAQQNDSTQLRNKKIKKTSKPLERYTTLKQSEETKELTIDIVEFSMERNDDTQLHSAANNNLVNSICDSIREGYKIMVLMRGLPGSGKTYLTKRILKHSLQGTKWKEFIFSKDDYLYKSRRYTYKPHGLQEAHFWCEKRVSSNARRGVSPIIIDDTNLEVLEMKVYCALGVQFGYVIEIIEVDTPWALDPKTLSFDNSRGLRTKEIKAMLERYERGVTVQQLLNRFKLVYTMPVPQNKELYAVLKYAKKKQLRHKRVRSFRKRALFWMSTDEPSTAANGGQFSDMNINFKDGDENSQLALEAKEIIQTTQSGTGKCISSSLKQNKKKKKKKKKKKQKEITMTSKHLEWFKETTLEQLEGTEHNDSIQLPSSVNNLVNSICDRIRKEYKIMVLMRGLPGSGKTYLSTKIILNGLGVVNKDEFIFSTDDCFYNSSKCIYNPYDLQEPHAGCQHRVRSSAERGVSPIIIDNTNLEILEMETYCVIAVQFGYIIEIIEIETPWFLNPNILSFENVPDLQTKEAMAMLERYETGVSTEQLLKKFKLIYTVPLPQYRKYPSFSLPFQPTAPTALPVVSKSAKKKKKSRHKCKRARSFHNAEQLGNGTGESFTTTHADQFVDMNTNAKEKDENSEPILRAEKIIQTTRDGRGYRISPSYKEALTSKPLKRSKKTTLKQSKKPKQLRSKTVQSTAERNGSIQIPASVNNNVVNLICDSIRKGYKIMVLMRGLPGSGKTYLAKIILEHSLRAVNRNEFIFSTDDYFNKLGRYIYNPHELQEAYVLCQKRVFLSAKRGVSPIIIDDANLEILEMEVYCNIAVQFGYLIEIVEITTPWVINPKILSLGNTRDLKTKKIKAMVKRHERDVTTEQLLSNFRLVYTVPVPQYREYPSFSAPIQPSATVVLKHAKKKQSRRKKTHSFHNREQLRKSTGKLSTRMDADQFLEMNTNANENEENSETPQAEKITRTTHAGIRCHIS